MTPYEVWQQARVRRNSAAYQLAKAFIAGNLDDAARHVGKFTAAEAEMIRIENELNDDTSPERNTP